MKLIRVPEARACRTGSIASRRGCCCAGSLTGSGPGEATLSTRRAVLRDLAELQKLIEAELDSHPLEKACHELVSAWSKDWLDKVRLALHQLTSTAAADSLPQGTRHRRTAGRGRMARRIARPARSGNFPSGKCGPRRRARSRVAGAVGSVAMLRERPHAACGTL